MRQQHDDHAHANDTDDGHRYVCRHADVATARPAISSPRRRPVRVTATLATLSPDATLVVGIALGTWSSNACQIVLSKDSATQSSFIIGQASQANTLLRSHLRRWERHRPGDVRTPGESPVGSTLVA